MKLERLESYISDKQNKDFYFRHPNIIAQHIEEELTTHKILFYGIGGHTQEVLKALNETKNVIGIIKESSVPEGYIEYNFNEMPILSENEIRTLDFDYIILLGAWNDVTINQLSVTLNLQIDKLYAPYKNKLIQEKIKNDLFDFSYVNKPIIVHLAWDSKNDIFSEAVENIANEFYVIKIYLREFHYENLNDIYFHNIFRLYNLSEEVQLFNLLEILNMIKPHSIVCTKPTMGETCFDYLAMKYKPNGSKFIFAPWGDIITYKASSLTDEELCDTCLCSQDELTELRYCEEQLIKQSDAVFSSLLGVYLETVLKKEAKKVLTSIFFMNPRYYRYQENTLDTLRLCYTGSLQCTKNDSMVWALAMDHTKDYKAIMEQNIMLGVYTFYHEKLDCYKQLQHEYKNFELTFNFEHWSFPQELQSYHFGLVWSNLLPIVKQKLYPGPQSVFLAKTLTYIASGIPIIVHEDIELMATFVQKYKIGLVITTNDVDNLKEIINECNYQELKDNVKVLQDSIALNEMNKIMKFFKELDNE